MKKLVTTTYTLDKTEIRIAISKYVQEVFKLKVGPSTIELPNCDTVQFIVQEEAQSDSTVVAPVKDNWILIHWEDETVQVKPQKKDFKSILNGESNRFKRMKSGWYNHYDMIYTLVRKDLLSEVEKSRKQKTDSFKLV